MDPHPTKKLDMKWDLISSEPKKREKRYFISLHLHQIRSPKQKVVQSLNTRLHKAP